MIKQFLQTDKLLHFFVSGWLFFTITLIFNDVVTGGIITSSLFIGKEFYDEYVKKTYFDLIDAGASLLGLIVSMVIYDVFYLKML
jgi:hypothetical protein